MAESEATRLLENQFRAAQATIRTLTSVVEQAEQHVEERDQKVAELAADLVEARSQRAFLAKKLDDAESQVEALRSERDATLAYSAELFNERNEARAERDRVADELAQTRQVVVRLTNQERIDEGRTS